MSSLEFPETCETVETNKGTEESQNIKEVSKVWQTVMLKTGISEVVNGKNSMLLMYTENLTNKCKISEKARETQLSTNIN